MMKHQIHKHSFVHFFAVFLMFSPLACNKNNDSKAKVQGAKNVDLKQCDAAISNGFNEKMAELTGRTKSLQQLITDKKTDEAKKACNAPDAAALLSSCKETVDKNKGVTCQADKASTATDKKSTKYTLKMDDFAKACSDYEKAYTTAGCTAPVVSGKKDGESTTVPETGTDKPTTTLPAGTKTEVKKDKTETKSETTTDSKLDPSTKSGTAASVAQTDSGTKAADEKPADVPASEKYSVFSNEVCLKFYGQARLLHKILTNMIELPLNDAEKTLLAKGAKTHAAYLILLARESKLGTAEKAAAYLADIETVKTKTKEQLQKAKDEILSGITFTSSQEPKNCTADAKALINAANIGQLNSDSNTELEHIANAHYVDGAIIGPISFAGIRQIFMAKLNDREGVFVVGYKEGKPATTDFYPFKPSKTIGKYKAMNFADKMWMFVHSENGAKDSFVFDADGKKPAAQAQ